MRRKRYLEKLEMFEEEMRFIRAKTLAVEDDVTRRALLYALEVCVDVVMDVVAMATKDKIEELYEVLDELVEVVERKGALEGS